MTGPSKSGRSFVWLAEDMVLGVLHSVCLEHVFGLVSVAASLGRLDVWVAASVEVGLAGVGAAGFSSFSK